jgi:hypothetical protein
MGKPSKKKQAKQIKKQREKKKKTLQKRESRRKFFSDEKKQKKLEYKYRERGITIKNPEKMTELEREQQIARNLEKIREYEKEYEREIAERQGLNEALEAEGFNSLQEKMDFLCKEAEKTAREDYKEQIE